MMATCSTCVRRRFQLAGAEGDVARVARRMARDDTSPRLRTLLDRVLADRTDKRQALDDHLAECGVTV